MQQRKGLYRMICKQRISGTCNSDDLQVRTNRQRLFYQCNGLIRHQQSACDSWPLLGFVLVVTFAERTADIAARTYRKMQTNTFLMIAFTKAEAGMLSLQVLQLLALSGYAHLMTCAHGLLLAMQSAGAGITAFLHATRTQKFFCCDYRIH